MKKSNFNHWLRRIKVDLDFPIIISSGLYDIDALYQKTPFIGKGQYKYNLFLKI